MARLIRLLDKGLVAPAAVLAAGLRRLRRRPASGPPALVALKLVGMGDAVLMLPALAAARAAGYRLTVITSRRCSGIFAAPGVADALIVFQRRGWARQLAAMARALGACQVVLDFEQHVFWSTALVQLAPLAARRHGFRTRSRRRNLGYDLLVEPGREPRPMKAIFDALAASAGLRPQPGLLPLPLDGAARAAVERWRGEQQLRPGQYIVMAPGSGATVGFRRLPAATWAQVAAGLPAAYAVVLVGTQLEAGLVQAIGAACGRPLLCRLDFRLDQLAALMADAAAVIATDSGPMHLAAAMGAPVAGIFGPDTPRRYAPANPRSTSVSLHLACSPCNNCWIYREARCVNPDRYACLRRLPAQQVLAAVAGLLASGPGRGVAAGEGAHNQG